MHFIGTKQLSEVRHVLDRIETRVRTVCCHHNSRWCEALQGGGRGAGHRVQARGQEMICPSVMSVYHVISQVK